MRQMKRLFVLLLSCLHLLFGSKVPNTCFQNTSHCLLGLRKGKSDLDFIAVDSDTLVAKVIYTDTSGDFLSTTTFGAIDAERNVYFTLMQPMSSKTIQLASFDFSVHPVKKSITPLEKHVACGIFTNNSIVGIDENGDGTYFARIDVKTGALLASFNVNQSFTMVTCGTLDTHTNVLYAVLGDDIKSTLTKSVVNPQSKSWRTSKKIIPETVVVDTKAMTIHNPHFFLYSFDASTGQQTRAPLPLNISNPNGAGVVAAVGNNTILSLVASDSGWSLVSINTKTGKISPTNTRDLPALHVLQEEYWLTPTIPQAGNTPSPMAAAFLSVLLSESLTSPTYRYEFDVECVVDMANSGSCITRKDLWEGYSDLGVLF